MRKQTLHPRTAIVNQKQKHHAKQARLEALRWLAARFPQAFDNATRIRPLKLGIMNDLLAYADEAAAAGISKSKLREAVVIFTRRVDYLTVLKAREMRIDLEGNPVEPVSEEEAERAALKIKKRVEKSAKNARKMSPNKPISPQPRDLPRLQQVDDEDDAVLLEEPVGSYHMHTGSTPGKPAPVIVKRKASKQYDPDAVARLKEKLGLAKKKESME
ncbi:ProQ/FinO family protein [Legionella londiniensis]|uniref:ProQ/FinO family protein n=1 Tax=Legionella londiniensis TaxID=45068 RepID=UPI00399D0BA8